MTTRPSGTARRGHAPPRPPGPCADATTTMETQRVGEIALEPLRAPPRRGGATLEQAPNKRYRCTVADSRTACQPLDDREHHRQITPHVRRVHESARRRAATVTALS